MTKPSALSSKNVANAAERAAAYTVAVMHYGAVVTKISLQNTDLPNQWEPWAAFCLCPKCAANTSDENISDVAVFAAEIMAMRPEKSGMGQRWSAIDLHGLQIAEEVVCGSVGKLNPMRALADRLNKKVTTPPTAQELDAAREEVIRLWEAAQLIVGVYRDAIDELAGELRLVGTLERTCSEVLAGVEAKVRNRFGVN